jgi:hypothetical protein
MPQKPPGIPITQAARVATLAQFPGKPVSIFELHSYLVTGTSVYGCPKNRWLPHHRPQEQRGLYSRPGNDLTYRFPLIVEALARLRSRSCIVDGEAVACDDNGVALFDLVRHYHANESVFFYAFDLIELNGGDLRRDPLEVRKATLASVLTKGWPRHPVQ